LDDVELVVSELVTNSVRHAKAEPDREIELSVDLEGNAIRIQVDDGGQGFTPTAVPKRLEAPGGLGLAIVTRVSESWGADERGVVWARVPVRTDRSRSGSQSASC
jgi:anti-sigma regulatory factor (Ser/Thr protein kinase)